MVEWAEGCPVMRRKGKEGVWVRSPQGAIFLRRGRFQRARTLKKIAPCGDRAQTPFFPLRTRVLFRYSRGSGKWTRPLGGAFFGDFVGVSRRKGKAIADSPKATPEALSAVNHGWPLKWALSYSVYLEIPPLANHSGTVAEHRAFSERFRNGSATVPKRF